MNKAKIYLTLIFFIILNIYSIRVLNSFEILIIGYPFKWFRLYYNGEFCIDLLQLLLHIGLCYILTLVSIKIIKKYN